MQFIRSPLKGGEVVTQGARNGLFESVLQRFLLLFQGILCSFAIMETVARSVNWHSARAFLGMRWGERFPNARTACGRFRLC